MHILAKPLLWYCLLHASAAWATEKIPVLTWPQGPPVMAPWHGRYLGGTDDHSGRVDLKLSASGDFLLRYQDATGFGCAVTSGMSMGKAVREGDWIVFRTSHGRTVQALFPVIHEGRHCLVKADELLSMVNGIHASGEAVLPALACRVDADGKPAPRYRLNASFAFPPAYRAMLLQAPLRVTVTAVQERIMHSSDGNGLAAPGPNTARLIIASGSASGVFAGMRLYANDGVAVLDTVFDDHATATFSWYGDGPGPWTGMTLGSAAPQAGL